MHGLTAETLWSIPRVGAPLSLPEGRLLVPVTTHDPVSDESATTVWRLDPESGRTDRFASGKLSGLDLSSDGTSLAFLREVDGHRQVHVQRLDGGEARRVTDLPRGAVGVRWAPDGRLLVMATLLSEHPTLQATRDHEPDDRLTVRTTENAVYRFWDMWLEDVYHPVLVDPDTGDELDLTPGATRFWSWPNFGGTAAQVDVSPDGSLVAFSADDSEPPHRLLSFSLFLVGADGAGLRRIDAGREGHSTRPRFTPDGGGVVYGYQSDPRFYADRVQLVRYDLETGEHHDLAAGWDRSPGDWVFDDAGRLLLTAEDRGRSRLYRLAPGGSDVEPLTDGGWVTDPSVDPTGVVHVLSRTLQSPPEVHRLVAPEGSDRPRLEQVTRFTQQSLEDVSLGHVREMTISGADGDDVQVWLVDPPDAAPDDRLPLVHMIHGGPHGVFGDTWHWRWNAQTVAAAGYRVAHVNFHGSTGWGQDFTASILGGWGDLPYRDVEAATDRLIALGLADEDRMAVTGGSYGGYLTAWITSQTDRYACAVAHAAVTNLAGMYASDLTGGRQLAYGAEIWEDKDRVERWSPAAAAAGQSTPTLVVHGGHDERVPQTQGLEYYGVLVAKGVPARLLSYPSENHWILSRTNSIHWYGEFIAWLDRWMSTRG